MRLTDTINKIKASASYCPDISKDLFVVGVILLAAMGSFLLGRLSVLDTKQAKELKIMQTEASVVRSNAPSQGDAQQKTSGIDAGNAVDSMGAVSPSVLGMYVGSKSGTTYYLPWCGGVKRIHEENKVWFKDKADATSKGYKPSSTCKGI